MDRVVLFNAVKDQMSKHVAEYKDALNGWRAKLQEACRKVHDDIATPSTCDGCSSFPKELSRLMRVPQEHKADFETVICMLESATDSVIELDQEMYERVVLGKFTWCEEFTTTNAMYRER